MAQFSFFSYLALFLIIDSVTILVGGGEPFLNVAEAESLADSVSARVEEKFKLHRALSTLPVSVEQKGINEIRLSGFVKTQLQHARAYELAIDTPGVEYVDNEIRIDPESQLKSKDKVLLSNNELKDLVRRALRLSKRGRFVEPAGVENGVVTISGRVCSRSNGQAVEQYLGDLIAVISVQNHTSISGGAECEL